MPHVPMILAAARTHAMEGSVESQDSQAVMRAMHRIHGADMASSSPVDPLEYDQELLQQLRQHAAVNAHAATASLTPKTKANAGTSTKQARSTRAMSSAAVWNAEVRQSVAGRKGKTPAVAVTATATPRDKGSGQGRQDINKGLAGGRAPAARTAGVRSPSPHARSTDASSDRVSFLHHPAASCSHSLRHQTVPHTAITSAPPIDQTKPKTPSPRHTHPNESIANSLSVAAPVRPVSPTYSKKGPRRKMDSSQSPTQSNDGRSYEQYLPRGDDLVSSDPIRQPRLSPQSCPPSLSPRNIDTTLHDDGTGQVILNLSDFARRDTQISVPDSIRTGTTTQQQHASADYIFGNPETPAARRNPFLGSKAAVLMGSSQMFKQTQYSSAFKTTFSPTSSRPSPDNLHLNSISPNPSPLKRVASGPSPLQGVSSLPQAPFGFDTSPQRTDEADTRTCEDEIATSHISKSFQFLPQRPIEEYRPIQRWDTRAASAQPGSDAENESYENMSDEEERRRQRVAQKKAKAERRLEAIRFERPSNEAILSATNQEEVDLTTRQYAAQCEGVSRRDSQISIGDLQDVAQDVADSQDGVVQLSADLPRQTPVDEGISSNDVVPNTDPGPPSAPAQTDDELVAQVPETSPARLRALSAMMPHSSEEESKPESFSKLLSSPPTGTAAAVYLRSVSRSPQQRTKDAWVNGRDALGVDADNGKGEPCIVVSSSPPAPAFSTRARLRAGEPPVSTMPTFSSTSPLSRLTTTPALSSKTTPLTEESPRVSLAPSSSSTDQADSSPAVAKAHRDQSKLVSKAAPNQLRVSKRRTTRQSFPSNISVSTDELAGSPRLSTPTVEQSTRLSRLGRTSKRESPALHNHSRGGAKIFAGMAFAISFQGKQPGEKDAQYKARMSISASITTKIKQAGGKVLPDGFDPLFEFDPVKNADREASSVSSTPQPDDEITLAPQARDTGFTALIADGHSRKAKYMQALALGLPCIHQRWITVCAEKNGLVDWSDYLLCAGNSSFLGDAVRSRNLSPYDAATAKLSKVIQHRPRLLDQSRILLLMGRADESRKAAYIFLARVLGASLSRVYTVDEASRQLKAREDAGRAFDWVYVVDDKVAVESMFVPPASGPVEGSKKRKRKHDIGKMDVTGAPPPPKRVQALSDELVIQSLILGRLMEEGEMKATAG